ncbi:ATP-binding protein [Xiamenia xianingshaonis]|uniref:ATP-binding protein n=1 Tax=Xiamenia xianingshaonis TaxID=2682776 RepID=UPI0028F72936|nr:AAA family ATPase [Xiamenia xianingshaonis]
MAHLKRKAMEELVDWKNGPSSAVALLVDGPRQVGKTYLIREFGRTYYSHVAEINLLEIEGAAEAFNSASNSDDLFARITLYASEPLVPHETLVFIDEVQEAPEMITAAKFLVQKEGCNYDFVFSGSLLGVELKDIKSWPVGYLREVCMHPLDFEEFCWACGLAETVLQTAKECVLTLEAIDPFVHERLLSLFYYYLVVGGMPQAVSLYVDTNNLQNVRGVQEAIIAAYRHDITKYCKEDPLVVKSIYDAVPSQLNSQSKRYTVAHMGKNVRISREQNKFLWLTGAGAAIAAYNVDEPRCPLAFAVNSTLFKLFMSDVGLLACASGLNVVRKTLGRESVNYGAVYENYVAQALVAQGIAPYYYRSRKLGELDFVIQGKLGLVLPVEVKSGKDYKRHAALRNVLSIENYGLEWGVVLSDGNVERNGSVMYVPIYAASFLGSLIERLEAL